MTAISCASAGASGAASGWPFTAFGQAFSTVALSKDRTMSDEKLPPINKRHRYLIRNDTGEWVSSTDDLGMKLPLGYCHVDTIGEDGLGTGAGNKGIPDFLKARKKGWPL
jgi:hypothetical protein